MVLIWRQVSLKGQVHSNSFIIYSPTESQVRFNIPQKISGASQHNNVAAFCERSEADGDLF